MDVTESLDQIRAAAPGCELVVFADLQTRMVLCVSAERRPAQEELDGLSDSATAVLDGAVGEAAAALVAGAPDTAIAMTAIDAHVFLRSAVAKNEALICVCAPDADFGKVVDLGRAALAKIDAKL